MANEYLPGPDQDPTLYWINYLKQSMTGEETFTQPTVPPPPIRIADVEHQAAMALDTEHREEKIKRVLYHPGGKCTVVTTYTDELGPEDNTLTFRLYGPPPKVGERARLYRSDGYLPRGLVFLGDEESDGPERLQFYETKQEYEETIRKRQLRLAGAARQDQEALEERIARLPDNLQARIDVMIISAGRASISQYVLRAEQALNLASHLPDPDKLKTLRQQELPVQLATLSNYMNVDGWDQHLASEAIDLAIFYLETKDVQ